MTLKAALALGVGSSLILAAGAANADCISEVRALQQQIGMNTTYQEPDANPATDFTRGSSTMSPSGDPGSAGTSTGMTVGTGGTPASPSGTSSDVTATNQEPDANPATDFTSGSSTMSPSGDPGSAGTSTSMTVGTGGAPASPSGTASDVTATNQEPDADPATDFASGSSTMSPSGDPGDIGSSTGLAATGDPAGEVREAPGTANIVETTRTGELTTSADNRSAALASLRQAEIHANEGREQSCMTELNSAKQHLGLN